MNCFKKWEIISILTHTFYTYNNLIEWKDISDDEELESNCILKKFVYKIIKYY